MLRPAPGALTSQRLEERPANLPSQLFVHGGRAPSSFDLVVFRSEGLQRRGHVDLDTMVEMRLRSDPLWLRIQGLGDQQLILRLMESLQVPAILLPPLLEVPQRPRLESHGEAVLVVLHRLEFADNPAHLISSQVGLLLLPGLLVSFEEAPSGDPFLELTDWLMSRPPGHGERDLDDVLHLLVDELLDDVFPMFEQIANRLDDLEEAAVRDPKPKLLSRAYQYRSNLQTIRRLLWPLRFEIRVLLRQRRQLLGEEARLGFQEIGELLEVLLGHAELLRYQCDAITQTYAASVGNRMNQVMKTLTILTSIFAPLTFIGGIYGMNFEHMPELHARYGYFVVLFLMGMIAAIQTYWLWRRGWFQDWTTPR